MFVASNTRQQIVADLETRNRSFVTILSVCIMGVSTFVLLLFELKQELSIKRNPAAFKWIQSHLTGLHETMATTVRVYFPCFQTSLKLSQVLTRHITKQLGITSRGKRATIHYTQISKFSSQKRQVGHRHVFAYFPSRLVSAKWLFHVTLRRCHKVQLKYQQMPTSKGSRHLRVCLLYERMFISVLL